MLFSNRRNLQILIYVLKSIEVFNRSESLINDRRESRQDSRWLALVSSYDVNVGETDVQEGQSSWSNEVARGSLEVCLGVSLTWD